MIPVLSIMVIACSESSDMLALDLEATVEARIKATQEVESAIEDMVAARIKATQEAKSSVQALATEVVGFNQESLPQKEKADTGDVYKRPEITESAAPLIPTARSTTPTAIPTTAVPGATPTPRPTPDHYSLFQKRLSSNGNCPELYRIMNRNKDPLSESVQVMKRELARVGCASNTDWRMDIPTATPRPTPTLRPTPTPRPTPTLWPVRPTSKHQYGALTHYERARNLYEKMDYMGAIEEYTLSIKANPRFTNSSNQLVLPMRAYCYLKLGYYELAIVDYTEVIRINSMNKRNYLNRGVSYERIEQYLLAIEDYTSAIDLDPTYALAFNNRSNGYRRLGLYTESKSDKSKACSLDNKYC